MRTQVPGPYKSIGGCLKISSTLAIPSRPLNSIPMSNPHRSPDVKIIPGGIGLPQPTWDLIDRIAESRCVSRSQLLREFIEDRLLQETANKEESHG